MTFEGHFDEESRTVSMKGADMELESVDHAIKWLTTVRRWIQHKQVVEDGGHRWEFRRGNRVGDEPTATLMKGREVWVREFDLVTIKPWKRVHKCTACGLEIEIGTVCWRQKPGSYHGHSHDRFCDRCVERGAAPRAPKLTVITGGAS